MEAAEHYIAVHMTICVLFNALAAAAAAAEPITAAPIKKKNLEKKTTILNSPSRANKKERENQSPEKERDERERRAPSRDPILEREREN